VPNPILSPPPIQTTELYDRDFCLWTETMAEVLRSGNLAQLDIANLAEEVESLGRRDRRELESRLVVLLHHLLKWQFQSSMRSRSWRGTLAEQRLRIRRLLKDSPSLRSVLESSMTSGRSETIDECYTDAKIQASEETGLTIDTFPADCPYAIEAVLSVEFLPD
jgi:Domain of unknown function DUF29